MGLTVHWCVKYTKKSPSSPRQALEQVRQRALDLPFDAVGEMLHIKGKACEDSDDDSLRWLLIQAGAHVDDPCEKGVSYSFQAKEVLGFTVDVAPGSEPMNVLFCKYPAVFVNREGRRIRTGLTGWSGRAFCKTQYSSSPACGGLPNFLRAHISVITLLEFAATVDGLSVHVEDEGKYGPSRYSDDWREAYAAGREPTYVDHPGQHDIKALAQEVGEWNEMIAAFSGALKDTFGDEVESAIAHFPDFEHLEAAGWKDLSTEQVEGFLKMLKAMPKPAEAEPT